MAGWDGHPLVDRLTAISADVVRTGIEGPRSGGRSSFLLVNKVAAQGYRFPPRALLRRVTGSIKL